MNGSFDAVKCDIWSCPKCAMIEKISVNCVVSQWHET